MDFLQRALIIRKVWELYVNINRKETTIVVTGYNTPTNEYSAERCADKTNKLFEISE